MQDIKIKRHNPRGFNTFRTSYRNIQLTYQILDALYDKTILKEIIQTFISNIIPPFYTLRIEDFNGERLSELELECKDMSRLIDRTYMAEAQKAFFLYGTALTYTGNRDLDGRLEEIFLLHPNDVEPVYFEMGHPQYGEIKFWRYSYGGYTLQIPPDDIKVYANDPPIGSIYGRSIVNHMQDTLAHFLNNRTDLAEILNRYAIPIVQWAVDVQEIGNQDQESFIYRVKRSLQEQFIAGDDLITDARVEPRTLSFANDVSHLISILDASRMDLGMLGVPEPLMGGNISNLSGGKIQSAVFMTKIGRYRAILNDYIAREFFIPDLELKNHWRGEDFHNIFLSFPLATTELPSDKIIWLKASVEMGFITLDEARMELGFRGKAPGVTDELKELMAVRVKSKSEGVGVKDGRDPDKEHDSVKKSTSGE